MTTDPAAGVTPVLVGQFDSPFARRVAVTLHLYGMPFERRALSVFGDFDDVLATNPLGKVPALELAAGEVLFDSQMILDWLDEQAGEHLRLTPARGVDRRRVLRTVAVGLGLAEKSVTLNFERNRRAQALRDPDAIARAERQVGSALDWLEEHAAAGGEWLELGRMTQADITAAAALMHVMRRHPHLGDAGARPMLAALSARMEALDAFRKVPFDG
jgi:glutathione S-transferase